MGASGLSTPWWLVLLAVIGALLVAYVLVQRRRRRFVLRFTNLGVLEQVMPRRPRWRRHVPAALLAVALICLVVGLAGPIAEAKVPRNRATVVLVMDVSLSMMATDVAPSRLAAAQAAATKFVEDMTPGINLGLVSFAGTASVLVPPTTGREPVVRQIQTLRLAESTATGDALATALTAIDTVNQTIPGGPGERPPARIVLMTDGARTVGRDEREVAGQAGRAGVPISAISFGTAYGSIDLDGDRIPVPADDAALAEIARLSGGQFYDANTADDITQAYTTLAEQVGYETVQRDVGKHWMAVGTLVALVAAGAGLVLTQRLPA